MLKAPLQGAFCLAEIYNYKSIIYFLVLSVRPGISTF